MVIVQQDSVLAVLSRKQICLIIFLAYLNLISDVLINDLIIAIVEFLCF